MRPATQPPGPGQWDQGRRPASPAHARLPPPPSPRQNLPTHHPPHSRGGAHPRTQARQTPVACTRAAPLVGGGLRTHTHTHNASSHPIDELYIPLAAARRAAILSGLATRKRCGRGVGWGGWVGGCTWRKGNESRRFSFLRLGEPPRPTSAPPPSFPLSTIIPATLCPLSSGTVAREAWWGEGWMVWRWFATTRDMDTRLKEDPVGQGTTGYPSMSKKEQAAASPSHPPFPHD